MTSVQYSFRIYNLYYLNFIRSYWNHAPHFLTFSSRNHQAQLLEPFSCFQINHLKDQLVKLEYCLRWHQIQLYAFSLDDSWLKLGSFVHVHKLYKV